MPFLKAYDESLFGGTAEDMPDAYRAASPITYAEQVRIPVFLLGGENDPRCPIRQFNSYVQRLEELGKVHDVYRYDAGHFSMVTEERLKQFEMQIAFAAKHLGTAQPT